MSDDDGGGGLGELLAGAVEALAEGVAEISPRVALFVLGVAVVILVLYYTRPF